MTFNYSKITHDDAIKIGSDDAPVKIVEYINLRCPDSKNYEENIAPFLNDSIQHGKVQRILKHFDKQTIYLELGNLVNQYLDYSQQDKTYAVIQRLFKDQSQWGANRLTDIPHIANDYGLSLQPANRDQAHRVTKEIEAVGVERIPTIFVNDQAFIETVELEAFKAAILKNM